MDPKISVILPVHNAEHYLNQAIESVLDQKEIEIQVIAIDDGSTDSSPDILDSFDDPRLEIVQNKENRGLIYSLNKGIDLAEAPYIARMDADDICLPGRFIREYEYLESHPDVDVVSSLCDYIDLDGKTIRKKETRHIADENIKFHLLFGNVINHPSVMIRKTIFDRFRYEEDYYIAEDYGLWAKIIANEKSIHIIDEPLIKYRLHENNISQNKIRDKFASIRKIIKFQLDRYQIDYTSKELDIQTSFAARKLASKYKSIEIENWLKKLYSQLAARSWNKRIAREILFYYYLQIYLTRHKREPWKWLKFAFPHQSFMPDKLIDCVWIMRQVIAEKMNS